MLLFEEHASCIPNSQTYNQSTRFQNDSCCHNQLITPKIVHSFFIVAEEIRKCDRLNPPTAEGGGGGGIHPLPQNVFQVSFGNGESSN